MGLRTAASAVSSDSDVAKIMAPALTEPVSHQSKISSPAQASSPRPLISDVEPPNRQTRTTNGSASYLLSSTKEPISSKRADNVQLTFVSDRVSNGPSNGSSAVTHMDQNNDLNQSHQPPELPVQIADQQQQSPTITTGTQVLQSVDQFQLQLTAAEQQQHQPQDSLQQFDLDGLLQQTSQSQSNDSGLSVNSQQLQLSKSQEQHLEQAVADIIQQSQNLGTADVGVPPLTPTVNNNVMGLQQKENAEMEQMLGDLSTSDIDLMQVLKSFESAPAGENLCDLAGNLSLFNDVDVMNIGLDDVVTNTSPSKESPAQEVLGEIEKKRTKMIRECDVMMRRLRKIQARHMGRHVSEEVYGVFEYAQQMIKRKERETKSISTMTPINQLQNDKHKLNSATSMKMLLKRIDQAATSQQTSPSSKHISGQTYGASLSIASPTQSEHYANNSALLNKHLVSNVVPVFEPNGTQSMEQCAGLLETELKLIEKAYDSDATESSSGGESADEMVSFNNANQQPLSIAKRAAYRWARDRARIASRWSWLLAQISDLEYRIRQHHELYLLLKKNNGPVPFDGVSNANQTNQVAGASSSDPQILPPQSSVNGYRGVLPGSMRTSENQDSELKSSGDEAAEANGTARTRPFKPSAFKKRKLLQSTNLHKISKRAARPCTIKCGCRWPVHPCLLCTGRQDPTAPRDLPDMLSMQESVALLDPCFHPILSFPEDVAQSVHIEGTLRQPEWQTKAVRTSSKAIIKGALALQKANEREDRNRKNSGIQNSSKKISSKKYNLVSTKLKKARNNNNNNRKLKKSFSHLMKGKSKSRKNSHISAAGSDIASHHYDLDAASPNGSRSINPSPTPGSSHKYERTHSERRHNKNAYDIDNIVIPYNIAAAHRVEVLSYKEIPTPKWRIVDERDGSTESTSQNESIEKTSVKQLDGSEDVIDENISTEAYQQRHERALAEERKKFSTFLKFPYSTRSRANRRIDSQADSSGANTPDPTSPAPGTPALSVHADQESAPATPQSVDNTIDSNNEIAQFPQPASVNNNNNHNNGHANTTNIGNNLATKTGRRRTVSFRKSHDPREDLLRRSNTPDIKETIPPFETLEFPLANDTIEEMIQCMPNSYKEIIDDCINMVSEETQKNQDETLHSNNNVSRLTEGYPDMAIMEDSDETESAQDEDPNDPEWCEPPLRPRT